MQRNVWGWKRRKTLFCPQCHFETSKYFAIWLSLPSFEWRYSIWIEIYWLNHSTAEIQSRWRSENEKRELWNRSGSRIHNESQQQLISQQKLFLIFYWIANQKFYNLQNVYQSSSFVVASPLPHPFKWLSNNVTCQFR